MKGSRVRSIVGLVAAAVVLGVFTLSPVAAHFTTNTKHLGQHAWKQFIKKQVNKSFQKKCKDGSVLAYVWVDASEAQATTGYSTASLGKSFNCAGGTPLVLGGALNTGLNYIKFPGITNTIGATGELIASATLAECGNGCFDRGMITADTITDGAQGRVLRISTQNDTGAAIDADYMVVVYGKAGTTTSPTVAESGNTAADRE